MQTLHLTIHGQVQGVSYRMSMRREAERLSLTGWVRNREDGSVEATVQGPPEAVDALVRLARQGPRLARVERVEIAEGEGAHASFAIRE